MTLRSYDLHILHQAMVFFWFLQGKKPHQVYSCATGSHPEVQNIFISLLPTGHPFQESMVMIDSTFCHLTGHLLVFHNLFLDRGKDLHGSRLPVGVASSDHPGA